MPESRTYYDILGVNKNASIDKIVSMHRKLAKKYHADANSTDPELQKWSPPDGARLYRVPKSSLPLHSFLLTKDNKYCI